MKYSIVLLIAATVLAQTSKFDYPTQIKNGPIYSDAVPNGVSLASLCATVGTGTLSITKRWANMTTQVISCALAFNGGSFQPASGQTVTINPNFTAGDYQQVFDTHLGGTIAVSGTAPPMNPNWFGADWTGSADSLAAFNAAYAAGVNLAPVSGTYRLSGQFVMGTTGSSLKCTASAWAAVIQYTGTSDINSLVKVTASNGTTIEGCGFKGNQHITLGLVQLNGVAGDAVRNIQCFGNTITPGQTPDACVYADGTGNTNTFDTIICQGQNFLNGIVLSGEFNDTIIRPKMEVITQIGIWLFAGSGHTIIGGTSEGNGTGLASSTETSSIIGLDLESDTIGFTDLGFNNHYLNTGGDFVFGASAHDNVVNNAGFANFTVASGARGITLSNSAYGGGTILDNGICTQFIHNWNTNGGNFYPDKSGCNAGVNFQGGINRFVEVVSANITAATCTGSPGVITYTAAGYALAPNFKVTITGASPSGYNVTQRPITVIDSSHFSVTLAGACPSAWVSGGATNTSANNALVVQLSSDAAGGLGGLIACPAIIQGLDAMEIRGYLAHSLQIGANALNFCGLVNEAIESPHMLQLGATRSVGDYVVFDQDASGLWIILTAASTAY